mmetsp:Transcript_5217/g.11499  ORF Transcript_5217/g.11499 Transcript_5217/m.11499 type:complete len:646 (+) Transcript_5217:52-1989(+)
MTVSSSFSLILGWWWLLMGVCFPARCYSEEIPVDYFADFNGPIPASYLSSSSWTPRRVSFDQLYVGLYNMTYDPQKRNRNQYSAAAKAVPVVGADPVIIDVLVFTASRQDVCQTWGEDDDGSDGGFWNGGGGPKQCFLEPERLAERGIGLEFAKSKETNNRDSNDDDHDRTTNFHICCTDKLVEAGTCESQQEGTLLLDLNVFQGKHLQWEIPVGATNVSQQYLTQSALSVKGGKFMVLLSSCNVNPYYTVMNHTDDKAYKKRNDIALYMNGSVLDFPWTLLGLWPFNIALLAAYGSTLIWYGVQVLRKEHYSSTTADQQQGAVHSSMSTKTLATEYWICLILFLSFMETSVNLTLWILWNVKSTVSLLLACLPYFLNVSKMILSFVLGLRLAQAAGTPHPAEAPSDQHQRPSMSRTLLRTIMILYGVLSLLHKWAEWSFLWADRHQRAPRFGYMTVISMDILSWYLITFLSVVMVVWMVVAVSRSIAYFESIQTDRASLLRYIRLRYILVLSAVASGATFASSSVMMPFLYTVSTTQIYISMLHDMFYVATLLGIAYLWQPRANRMEYNYLTSLLLETPMEHDLEHPVTDLQEQGEWHQTDIVEFADPHDENRNQNGRESSTSPEATRFARDPAGSSPQEHRMV